MLSARKLAAAALAAVAMISLTGCGFGGDHKLGETATVTFPDEGSYDVTITSVEPAPAEVVAKFDTKDPIYFVHFTTKMNKQGKSGATGVDESVLSKIEGNTYITTSFSSIDQCQKPGMDERKAAFGAGKSVTSCVPIAGDDGKKVVGVYIGSTNLQSEGSQTWTIS